MEIIVKDISKIYDYNKVISGFNFHFKDNNCYGISGANGSGKSTLIKILSGFLSYSEGTVSYLHQGNEIKRKDIFNHTSIAAPYSSALADFTLRENFEIIAKFKKTNINYKSLLELLEWKDPKEKQLRNFSSGMLQRTNVCLSLIFDSALVLLDEPTSYLDEKAKEWFNNLVSHFKKDRMIIIASNEITDFFHCAEVVAIK